MYTVYAKEYPGAEWQVIAELVTQSEMVTSLWGDTKMFFRHSRFDDDLMLKPEWVQDGWP